MRRLRLHGFRAMFALMVTGVALAIAVTIGINAWLYARFDHQSAEVAARRQVASELTWLGKAMTSTEIAALTFLLLDHDTDRAAFDRAAAETRARVARVEAAGARTGEQADVARLGPAIERVIEAFDAAVRPATPADLDDPALELRVREAMGAANRALDRAIGETERQLAVERGRRDSAQQQMLAAVMVGGGLALALTTALFLAVWREFGHREAVERDLRASEASRSEAIGLLNAALEQAPLVMVLVDQDGGAKMLAGQLTDRVWQPDSGELSLANLPPRYDELRPMIAAALGGESVHATLHLDPWVYDASVRPFEHFGQRGAMLTFWDVTERERAAEVRRRAEQLQALSLVAGGIAHDLNNALVTVMLSLDLAVQTVNDPEAGSLMGEAYRAAERAGRLGRAMLMYTGRAHREAEPIDVAGVIRALSGAPWLPPRRVRFQTDDGGLLVQGDPAQLQQLVENLVLNAVEATAGGGDVTVRTSSVALAEPAHIDYPFPATLPPGRYLRVEVRDTGEGMDAETLSHAFEPFYTTKFTGRGLGLAAAMGIVRGHGGAIDVRSLPGEGSTFVVLLPAPDEATAGRTAA